MDEYPEDTYEDNVLQIETLPTKMLSYPLPTRCRVTTERGWATKPWGADDVRFALQAGAWFDGQRAYQFESAEARRLAFPNEI